MTTTNPYQIKSADIIVGIPSFNEADNIAFVVEQCNIGLKKYFPDLQSVIINVDNSSPDDTRSAFLNSVNSIPKIYVSTEPGVTGKGNNFYNLFKEAVKLAAKAIVVVDADITSITPEWIRDLAYPVIMNNFDYVTPLYSHNEYDGTITNNICYPLIYGLLGKDIRQPIGGDFAFSGNLAIYYLQQEWHETTFQYGIDIFMTLNALLGDFTSCQAGLGAKIHKPSAPKLGPMFTQVVNTLFESLLNHKDKWLFENQIEKMPLFGQEVIAEPQSLSIDYKSIKTTAVCEYYMHKRLLMNELSPESAKKIEQMYETEKIEIDADLWTKAVYDLLFAYERNGKNPAIIEALKPLYFGRVITFIRQTLDLDHIKSELEIQRQAKCFYKNKNYLMDKYKN